MPLATGKRNPPLPLGDAWRGFCGAVSAPGFEPDPVTQQQLCNFGYAREKCPRCTAAQADAVRFSISHDREGLIRIYWVMEKDHLPVSHGLLDYARAGQTFTPPSADACLAQQARAYVRSYQRRKGEPLA